MSPIAESPKHSPRVRFHPLSFPKVVKVMRHFKQIKATTGSGAPQKKKKEGASRWGGKDGFQTSGRGDAALGLGEAFL